MEVWQFWNLHWSLFSTANFWYAKAGLQNTLAALCKLMARNQVDGDPWLGLPQKAETEV